RFEIRQAQHLAWAMHVSVRDRNEPDRDIRARANDVVGIRARAATARLDWGGDTELFAGVAKSLEDVRVHRGAASQHGSAAKRNVVIALFVRARIIRRMCD